MVHPQKTASETTPRDVDITHSDDLPRRGDHYRCQSCGMEFEVTVDCGCANPEHVHFECCDRDMARV
jgi:hypothetical protein